MIGGPAKNPVYPKEVTQAIAEPRDTASMRPAVLYQVRRGPHSST